MTYASVENVATAIGRSADSITETERGRWGYWLGVVERAIGRAFQSAGHDLASAVASGDPTEEDVADVEIAAVARKLDNPIWGQTSRTISHTIDDGSGSETSRNEGGGAYRDPLALLPAEITALLPSVAIDPPAYSVRPTFEPDDRCWP